MADSRFSSADRNTLRELAKRQLEHARSDSNIETIALWKLHNSCLGERPMIHLELDTFEHEIIPQRLSCEHESARYIERQLYKNFLNRELFLDDHPVPDFYPVAHNAHMVPFGLEVKRTYAVDANGGATGHRFNYHISDLEDDYDKLSASAIRFDLAATEREIELVNETIGDILPARLTGSCLYCVPTQDIVHIMGMETMFFSMYDYPELFHEMMRRYVRDVLKFYDFLESEKLLLPTDGYGNLGQGSWCYNDELPKSGALTPGGLWGFMDSQETVAISPEMFGEFIFPYYKEIAEKFGLLSYGCCEPVHPIWDGYISSLGNLRKVSISPWCDERFMAERLKGKGIIFHRKPSANYLGVGTSLDESAFRNHIRETIAAANGVPLEITQRDVYTINSDEQKARRYIEIIREEAEAWKA